MKKLTGKETILQILGQLAERKAAPDYLVRELDSRGITAELIQVMVWCKSLQEEGMIFFEKLGEVRSGPLYAATLTTKGLKSFQEGDKGNG